MPELNRDPFERFEEFKDRINNYPPVPAGRIELIKKEYSFHIGKFPIRIKFQDWTENITGMPSISKNSKFCIQVSPNIAQELYQSKKSHTLYVKLKSTKDSNSALDCIEIFWNNHVLPIEPYTGIMKPLKNESESDYQNRILSYNDIPVGEGKLLKEQYDITMSIFPIMIEIDTWFKSIFNNVNDSIDRPLIVAERDIARDIYEHSNVYPVKAKLKVNGYDISLEKLYLDANNKTFRIENMITEGLISSNDSIIEPIAKMEFIYVQGETFQRGDLFDEGKSNEKPIHDVKLDNFYIGKYPVTQGQWKTIMNNNPSRFKKGDNYPVEKISWDNAQEFIKQLNEYYKNEYVFRLPTEAEWEFAARSGGKKEKFAGGDNLDALAWYSDNSNKTTHPVGEKLPNSLGLFDMSGNIWEWCFDIFYSKAYSQISIGGNPVCLNNISDSRVIRGGGWNSDSGLCRSACRGKSKFDTRSSLIGFRVVASQFHPNKKKLGKKDELSLKLKKKRNLRRARVFQINS